MSEIKKSDGRGVTCSVPEPPACIPCAPVQRPDCRPPEPAFCPRGLRRVCCAPSAGQRPPCVVPPMASPKTCRHAKVQNNVDHCGISKCRTEQLQKCGDNLDRVARRLTAAERTRRLDYEREVGEGKAVSVSHPIAYNLVDERKCMRATDGYDYTVSKQSLTKSQCGPNRTPPPACPVLLKTADNCKISHIQHLEPCTHRPRIFLEIDRSQNHGSTDKSIASTLNPEKDGISASSSLSNLSSSTGSLTTRIIDTFKNSKGSCPRRSCKQSCISANTRYAGDTNRCANIPSPDSILANCKEPSLTERLRRRSGILSSKPCGSSHRLHTKTCAGKTSEIKYNTENLQNISNISKLESILHERSQLKEAGLGRVILMQQIIKEMNPVSTGIMELQIPSSSESVRVCVSLNFGNSKSKICEPPSNSHFPIAHNSSCTNDCSGSWLSINNLQKKLTGCQKHESKQTLEKSTVLGTFRFKPDCGKKPFNRPCTPKSIGEVGPMGKVSKYVVSETPLQSTCSDNRRLDPRRCSFKKDFLNNFHINDI